MLCFSCFPQTVSGQPSNLLGKMLHVFDQNWFKLVLWWRSDFNCIYTCRGSVVCLSCADILFPISNSNSAHIRREPRPPPPLFLCLSFFSPSFFFGLPLSLPLTFPSHPILLSSPFFNFKTLWSRCQPGDPLPSPETKLWDYLPFLSTAHSSKEKYQGRVVLEPFQVSTLLENMFILVPDEPYGTKCWLVEASVLILHGTFEKETLDGGMCFGSR